MKKKEKEKGRKKGKENSRFTRNIANRRQQHTGWSPWLGSSPCRDHVKKKPFSRKEEKKGAWLECLRWAGRKRSTLAKKKKRNSAFSTPLPQPSSFLEKGVPTSYISKMPFPLLLSFSIVSGARAEIREQAARRSPARTKKKEK